MTKKKDTTYASCTLPGDHRDHLCHLMDRGQTEEIRRRTSRPAHVCANCGARADEKEALCNPRPLQEE